MPVLKCLHQEVDRDSGMVGRSNPAEVAEGREGLWNVGGGGSGDGEGSSAAFLRMAGDPYRLCCESRVDGSHGGSGAALLNNDSTLGLGLGDL
eukprot:CAMPEP_0195029322 /NCGR_PEP_ID=MMETSP0326_2-20130528/56387_1 /TAXON_ID=2866 ORGANISM="Crypthecodinium cohnii, Strain Seligo" /NCGR_SAMPLE_ID=MMETSP0326_2 /ASSEMBLY_ACC=CAM_ASM_000348 /LENGTH=92 /DNA_ID=CAMNT_0040052173 /DNA_START=355 /DNA_END=629 /DNA_ORIENTATION=-